jgi:hypothetical protein
VPDRIYVTYGAVASSFQHATLHYERTDASGNVTAHRTMDGGPVVPLGGLFTDASGTVPCAVPGLIESDWWPRIFFIVFKAPAPGQQVILPPVVEQSQAAFCNRSRKRGSTNA